MTFVGCILRAYNVRPLNAYLPLRKLYTDTFRKMPYKTILLKRSFFTFVFADSVRILFATWWLFAQVLTSFYTAQLTAYLTLTGQVHPVSNMDDLINRPHPPAKWLAIEGYGFKNLLEVSR